MKKGFYHFNAFFSTRAGDLWNFWKKLSESQLSCSNQASKKEERLKAG